MSCTRSLEELSARVDGETTERDQEALELHIQSCGACASRLERLRTLKHAVAQLDGKSTPTEAVQARVEAMRLRFLRPAPWRRRGAILVAAALMVSLLGAGLFLLLPRDPDSLSEELITDHLRYAPEAMPGEVSSEDPARVRRFFEGQVPFDPVVPRLGEARLVGGRVCQIRDRKVELLFYEYQGRPLSLYVADHLEKVNGCRSEGDHHVCGQRRGSMSLMLVGDGPEGELRRLIGAADFSR